MTATQNDEIADRMFAALVWELMRRWYAPDVRARFRHAFQNAGVPERIASAICPASNRCT